MNRGQIHSPGDGNHAPRRISEQVAHLRFLADISHGDERENWAAAADTIEALVSKAEMDDRGALAAPLFESEDKALAVVRDQHGVLQFNVGPGHDFRTAKLWAEDVAMLNHALDQWIARFTSGA